MQVIEQIEAVLKDKGYRFSRFRSILLRYLLIMGRPVSVGEILDHFKEKEIQPNKTTVYRELDSLLSESVVKEVDLIDGKKRYELAPDTDTHYHVVCRKCHDITCVEVQDELTQLRSTVNRKTHFTVEDQVLEFFGLCPNCQFN